ncbi:translation initiation factor [Candidatus Sulfidibacterium hydrothermale]|uniref:translation initiation factor n=1 Tax=Candidatus Sulfidibacterium hydrothermale TaxID=2875962 RepID=UPI001F0B119A|nr:translation initiation factor [Candidatus Sulfidibacterium hydrothermale]UBM61795.1 translation initiation factor [Candidatus Sulfidibacterium hydrothermale]
MTSNKKNSRMVYSTNPDFSYEEEPEEVITPPPSQQLLYVSLDKKQRKGKKVTLVTGFTGNENDLKALGKKLKSLCGTGGSVKNEEIIIQGDFRERVKSFLEKEGFKVKQKGG